MEMGMHIYIHSECLSTAVCIMYVGIIHLSLEAPNSACIYEETPIMHAPLFIIAAKGYIL